MAILLQTGGKSDRFGKLPYNTNANLYQQSTRALDQLLPHEDLMPNIEPATLFKPEDKLDSFLNLQSRNQLGLNGITAKLGLFGKVPKLKVPDVGLSTASGVIGGVGMAANFASNALAGLKKQGPMNTWGIESQTGAGTRNDMAVSALSGAGKGASAGASIGSAAGPLGTVIGGAIGLIGGAIGGLFKGKKQAKQKAKEYKDNTQAAYEDYNQKANAQQYAALAKCGAKLSIMKKVKSAKRGSVSWHGKHFKKAGGKLNAVGEVNIIPSGTLHKENNNLGQKDKGLPIIDNDGKKIFEVEREELILRLKTTKDVENLVDKYKKSNNSKHLVDLGKLLSDEIMTNTHDFSGRYGMEVK